MRTQKEYMNCLKQGFNINIVWKSGVIDAYSYRDNRARDCIAGFISFAKSKGLKFSNCYHAHGIGNNCQYPVYYDADNETQHCANININSGMYGDVYVSIEDYNGRKVSPIYKLTRNGITVTR